MKILFSIFFVITVSLNAFGQGKKSFEGLIHYDIEYISKDSNKAEEYLGNTATVYMKQGNYRQEYPNTEWITSVLYKQESNLYYLYFNNSASIGKRDCSIADDTIIDIVKSNKTIKVLNRKCKSITLRYRTKTATYFYDKNLYVDPAFFTNHKYGSYDVYTRETESVYLKLIISDATSDFIMTANKISLTGVDDKKFDVENNGL